MLRFPPELADTVLAFLGGLAPPALGAAVSLAYEKGLTWTDRFVQFAVGVIVSWFAGRALGALVAAWFARPLDPFVMQGITFTLGMIAFKATPRVTGPLIEIVAELPAALRERLPFLKKKEPGA